MVIAAVWWNMNSGYLCTLGYREISIICERHDNATRAECVIDPGAVGTSWKSTRIDVRSSGTVVASWEPPIILDMNGRAPVSRSQPPVSNASAVVDRNGGGVNSGDSIFVNATAGSTVDGLALDLRAMNHDRDPRCGADIRGEAHL